MTIQDRNIIWLDLFEFLGYHKKRQLLDMFEKDDDIKASFLSNKNIYGILTEQEIAKMTAMASDEKLDKIIESYNNSNVITITIYDERYPAILKEIATPPLCLYCKGNIQLLDSYCVGVVGSRRSTDYGLVVTEKYTKALVEADVTIVSGMALGVDTIAHKTALENEGKTIAVLAGGFNHIYPVSNINLFKRLIENNLVITENNPNIPPLSY
jgi:DNA processing protein